VRPQIALIIGAIATFAFGLAATVLPTSMLPVFGLGATNEAIVLSRHVGVTLIGVGVINWMARDGVGVALRAILVGNLVIQALLFVINGYEIAVGTLPVQTATGMVIHLLLGAIFVLAMTRAR